MTAKAQPAKPGTDPGFKEDTRRLIDSVKGRSSKAIKRVPDRAAAAKKRQRH